MSSRIRDPFAVQTFLNPPFAGNNWLPTCMREYEILDFLIIVRDDYISVL